VPASIHEVRFKNSVKLFKKEDVIPVIFAINAQFLITADRWAQQRLFHGIFNERRRRDDCS